MNIILKDYQDSKIVNIRLSIWEAWILGGIALGFALFTIALEIIIPEMPQEYQITIIVLSALAYGITTIFIYRYSKNSISKTDSPTILPEYRKKYYQVLKDLIKSVESDIPNSRTKTLFGAIKVTHTKHKQLLLQHFYTDENYFHKGSGLFSTYKRFSGFDNDITNDEKILVKKMTELVMFLEESASKGKKFGTWFEPEKLDKIFRLPTSVIQLSINHYNFPNFYNEIPFRLEVSREVQNKTELLFVVNRVVLGGTNSEKYYYDLVPKINEYLSTITEGSHHMIASRQAYDDFLTHGYDHLVEVAIEPLMKGEAIIGVCDGCIEHFNPNEKKNLKKLLDKFRNEWADYKENSWTDNSSFFSNTRSK